ncbi:MAG: hypothetical protein JO322_08140 [Candidatus Eremiobacteraeota bacterium]|nr:hypothetical protein [Candidatus Eremiobacteraeota bacterium]
MRAAIYVALLVACVAAAPVFTRAALASAAAVLFEMLPYAAGAALLAPVLGRFAPVVAAYAGCGCSDGPGARSVPAAFACAALFGPHVAFARWFASIAVAAFRRGAVARFDRVEAPLLQDLASLAPAAALAGMLNAAAPMLSLAHRSPLVQLGAGAILGFFGAPCALGGVAVASSLRAQSPIAAATILCVAGIIDLRVWVHRHDVHAQRDRSTYALLSVACAIVAYGHGASLVHPRLTVPLWGCAALCALLATRSGNAGSTSQRVVGALLAFVALAGSPPPAYVATEGTLEALYPGERIDFTGAYVPNAHRPRVIRYAITCCRADARPVAIALENALHIAPGNWITVHGIVRRRGEDLVVTPGRIVRIAPPADPFVYL